MYAVTSTQAQHADTAYAASMGAMSAAKLDVRYILVQRAVGQHTPKAQSVNTTRETHGTSSSGLYHKASQVTGDTLAMYC
jgi:hypothetical protein